jgi:D-galactarolactone cycloisomerase
MGSEGLPTQDEMSVRRFAFARQTCNQTAGACFGLESVMLWRCTDALQRALSHRCYRTEAASAWEWLVDTARLNGHAGSLRRRFVLVEGQRGDGGTMSNLGSSQRMKLDLSFVIEQATTTVMRVPCRVPVETSFGTMRDRPALFVELSDGAGNPGVGEVWCNFPACAAEHRARLLETAIFPALLNRPFETPEQCHHHLSALFARLAIQSGEPGPIAQCLAGLDLAIWDLVARRAGQPVFRILGATNPTVPAYASGINPSKAVETVERCRDEGHRAFKLKVGFTRDGDLHNVEEICDGLAGGEQLMVDANQAWTPEAAVEILPALAEFPLNWLEEPIMANAPAEAWRTLAASTAIPLAAGENLVGAAEFDRAISGDWLDVLQPDACKWGGISGVLPIARKALEAKKRYCPHYLGGGVGLAASAHLLAAVGGDGLLEIDVNENPLRSDVFAPTIADGMITLTDAPGFGVSDAFDALKATWTA